jgi:hypothetical protein
MRPVGAADWRRLPTILLRTLSYAHVFLNIVSKRLIKFNYWVSDVRTCKLIFLQPNAMRRFSASLTRAVAMPCLWCD